MTKENAEEKIKIGFVSLGCDKNRVDTEKIITVLTQYSQFTFVADKTKADVILINTCAFLKTAREEAEATIKEMGEMKFNNLKKLIVAGCLPLLEKEKILKKFPEVDAIVVPSEYEKIDEILFKVLGVKPFKKVNEVKARILTTPKHYAYLKIADGCNNRCAYCKIPFIRGNYKSIPMEEILAEAEALCEKGVREIILVA
ncbi:MAG: radical SAM protein, partial [Clostridia bacterium]|nr:radical SAM protein [Clostridia bacterium]